MGPSRQPQVQEHQGQSPEPSAWTGGGAETPHQREAHLALRAVTPPSASKLLYCRAIEGYEFKFL